MDGGAWWAAVHGDAKSWTRLSDFTFTFHFSLSCIGEGNGNPLQCSCLENPRVGGAWWAAVYGVTQGWTRLKRLSSSSSPRSTGQGRKNAGGQAGESRKWRSYWEFNRNSGRQHRAHSRVSMHALGRSPWLSVSFAGRRHSLPSTAACSTRGHVHSAGQK